MLLELKRRPSTPYSTIGGLFINGTWFCCTLEDVIRAKGLKKPGETAIPAGEYLITLDFSNRFQKVTPRLLNVPNFEGVRIHALNFPKETSGCIGVGLLDDLHPDTILHSRDTYAKLFPILEKAFGREVICISITNPPAGGDGGGRSGCGGNEKT